MKLSNALISAAALLLACAWTPAIASNSASAKTSKTLPVLVTVNSQGDVIAVTPAYKLRPRFMHTVRDRVRKMITKPAMKDGKAVRSQLVMTFQLVPVKANDNDSHVRLKYLGSQSLPPDTWYWVHLAYGKLALSNQHSHGISPGSRLMTQTGPTQFGYRLSSNAAAGSRSAGRPGSRP